MSPISTRICVPSLVAVRRSCRKKVGGTDRQTKKTAALYSRLWEKGREGGKEMERREGWGGWREGNEGWRGGREGGRDGGEGARERGREGPERSRQSDRQHYVISRHRTSSGSF